MKGSQIKISNVLVLALTMVCLLGLWGCSSSPTASDDEEALIALGEEAESLEEEISAESGEGFGEEESAEEDIGGEQGPEEAFSGGEEEKAFGEEAPHEEFAEEEAFGEEAPQEEFAEEEAFGEEPLQEEFAEEEPFGEEPLAEEDLALVEEPLDVAEELPAEDNFVQDGVGRQVDILNIEFKSNESGGTVVIETSGPTEFQQRLNVENNQFVIEIPGANLPDSLKRPYIMKEFEGAYFAKIDAYQDQPGGTARIVIQMKGAGEPLVQQEGTSILVLPSGEVLAANEELEVEEMIEEPAPAPEPAPEIVTPEPVFEETVEFTSNDNVLGAKTLEEFLAGDSKYYGSRVSVQFRDAEVREVIEFLSQESGVNMVVSDKVKGRVTVKLRQVPWDQALIVVMKAKNLGYIRQGSIIRIATLTELKEESELAKQMVDSQKAVIPLKVKVMPISYADVTELAKKIMPFLTPNRGGVVEDKRTSSIIVKDVPDIIRKVTRLVKELDIPPAQVMIESKIVEATEDFQKSLGISWGFNAGSIQSGGGANGPLEISPSLNIRPTSQELISGAAGAFRVNVGTLDVFGDFDAALSLAERDALARIISSPRIIAVNKEEAEISQTGQVISLAAVQDQSGNVSSQVQRTPVELKLKVVPQITAGGSVIMDVEVKRQFAGALLDQLTLARAVNSREAKTKVLVLNGQTAVIGGIYQTDETDSVTGVPGLKDIPVIGWLFKDTQKGRTKNELLIFLTPRILDQSSQSVAE